MLGKFLTTAINSNPIVVKDASTMSLYLEEKYEGQFVKYTGKSTSTYIEDYVYQVVKKDNVYVFIPSFALEALSNRAQAVHVLDGYSAYNDKGERLDGKFKLVSKDITENGTYLPSADNGNAYDLITVNVPESGGGVKPFVATTDDEMDSYLTEEYDGAFVKMEYAKYKNATFPVSISSANIANSNINLNISKRRMRNFIDSWTKTENNNYVLEVDFVQSFDNVPGIKSSYRFRAYRSENKDGSIFRLLYAETHFYMNTSTPVEWSEGQTISNGPIWVDNYKGANSTLPEIAQYEDKKVYDLDFDSDSAKEYINGWTQHAVDYNNIDQLDGDSVFTEVPDANVISAKFNSLVILNAIANDGSNKYSENETYKVVFDKYITETKYQAESPFEVGDTFAGATMYFNTEMTNDEFENDVLTPLYDGYPKSTIVFFNMDNPPDMDNLDVNEYGALLGLALSENELLSYSYLEDGNIKPIRTEEGFVIDNIKILESLTDDDITITAPETITQIYRSGILNQFVGKTATFTKQFTTYATYKFEQQIGEGDVAEIQRGAELEEYAIDDNIGKVYKYVGENDGDFENGALYLIAETL